ncbi:hypothetical protein BDN72DRAFT_55351 [Pluteus cervinus]|uniref:Uncharacterized protein n=1 Tax=Pluteus cervinus TaxID=181527 RepID=A0ACD3BA45_9AGAR|nr:hypothetical protein BDN72DRAFT_55351 [Pluteus cervinus]
MSHTNINDADSVKALLEQLRSSSAWQDATTAPTNPAETTSSLPNAQLVDEFVEHEPTATSTPGQELSAPANTASTLASLLAQLQQDNSTDWVTPTPPPLRSDYSARTADPRKIPVANNVPQSTAARPRVPETSKAPRNESTSTRAVSSTPLGVMETTRDVRALTFQQSLPLLAELGEDPTFVELVTQMKKEQDNLERQLWSDRREVIKKYEEKVKVAKTKASMIGTGLSKHEAGMINVAFKKELEKLDVERVLPAWDGLISKQQATLAQQNVPTMFVTKTVVDRERQHRVMQVLEGLVREENS